MNTAESKKLAADAFIRMLERELLVFGGTPTPRLAYLWVRTIALSGLDPHVSYNVVKPAILIAVEMIASLTPRQLLTTFPVEKQYDGARRQVKDYFSTMESVSSHFPDQPIGHDEVLDLLWDYSNRDIQHFLVLLCGTSSESARREGRKDAFELFFNSPRYTSEDGSQYVSDFDGSTHQLVPPRLALVRPVSE